jgi:transposase
MTAGTSENCVYWSGLLRLQREVTLADVEIIERVERRRKWTAKEKAALLAEVEAEGGNVMVLARRHRISGSVLYNWRAASKAAAPFIPLGVFGGSSHRDIAMLAQPETEPARQVRGGDGGSGGIEIVLPNGARVRVDAATAKARGYRSTRNLTAIVYLLAGKIDMRLPA